MWRCVADESRLQHHLVVVRSVAVAAAEVEVRIGLTCSLGT